MQCASWTKASAASCSPGFLLPVLFAVVLSAQHPDQSLAQDRKSVRAISIRGTGLLTPSTVRGWLDTKPGGPFITTDPQKVVSNYAAAGYPLARVDSLLFLPAGDSAHVDVILWVYEGKPAFVSIVRFDGMKVLSEASAREQMLLHPGERFVPAVLEQDIRNLLKLYGQSGYPLTRIAVRDISFEEHEDSVAVAVQLSVDEGKQAIIRELRVEGNSTTKTGVIVREARLTDHEIFQENESLKIRQRLERLQLFSSVSTPELYFNSDGSAGYLVKVTEGNPNQFDGIAGYVPSTGSSGGGYFTGLVDLRFRNILGTGRRLAARWYRENQSSQEINLSYHEPWVASLPVNADAGFGQRKQDSTYIRNTFTLSADLMATDQLTLGALFSSERVLPSEGYGSRIVSRSLTTSVGFVLAYDHRDDVVTPTTGFRYRTEYQTGVKQIEGAGPLSGTGSSATQRLSFDLEYYLSLFQAQVLALNVSARDFRSGAVEISDLFRLGGAGSLRGYREGQFLGSRLAWSNLEYRVLSGGRSYVFGFVDFGYVLSPDRPEVGLMKEELSRMGYGIGVRLDTPLGLLGLSLALGQGDTFSSAKLHMRLINEF